VRLWDAGGSCLATIEHPGCVWAVAFTSAGDLVSGCSDAVGRVWSASAERQVRLVVSVMPWLPCWHAQRQVMWGVVVGL
jgi:WD40 repeat protein